MTETADRTGRARAAPRRHRGAAPSCSTPRRSGCSPTRRAPAGGGRSGHRQDHAAARGRRSRAVRTGDARARTLVLVGAGGRPASCGSGWRARARATGRPTRASRWCARCTPTRSGCCGCTPPGTATRRRGCWPAPSRTPWCATCWPARSTATRRARAGPTRLRAGASGCPVSPPSCASCCCARPSAGSGPDELRELGRRHEVAGLGGGRPVLPHLRAGQPAARGGGPGRAAGHRARAGRRRAGGRGARRAGLRPASCWPPSGERVRHLVVDDAQDLDPQQMELVRVLGRHGRPVLLAGDPDQAVLNFRGADPRACGPSRPRRWCSPSTTAARPRCGRPARGWRRLPGAARPVRAGRRARPTPAEPTPAARRGRRASRCGSFGSGRPRRPAGWPTSCAAPTSPTACRGRGWRCWPAPPAARCPRCAGRCWPPGCRSPRPPTSCRWPASPPSCRC